MSKKEKIKFTVTINVMKTRALITRNSDVRVKKVTIDLIKTPPSSYIQHNYYVIF